MNIKPSPFFFKRLFSIFSLFMMMCLFQNCGTSEESLSEALTDYEAQQADALPFAFDLTVDHIGYMSCESDRLQNSKTHFNFKAGAFNNNSGLKFKEGFLSSSAVGGLRVNKAKLVEYLAASKRNVNAGVVLSIRESADFRGPLKFGTSSASNFVSPMLWNPSKNVQLTESTFSGALYENPDGINYISGLSGISGKTFEGQLSYNGLGVQKANIRSALEGAGYLAFTFAVNDLADGGEKARSPFDNEGRADEAKSSVFGKGYKMNFAQIDFGRPSSPRRMMTSVQGFNLENESSLSETWTCPTNEHYIVMRNVGDAMRRFDGVSFAGNNPWDSTYNDGGKGVGGYYMEYMGPDIVNNSTAFVNQKHKVLCPTVPDEMLSGQAEHTDPAWKRVRSLLSTDEWYVFRGDRYNCIVPKKNDNACYGDFEQASSRGNPFVQYFATEDLVEKAIENHYSGTVVIPVTETDCEGSTPTSAGRYCPQVFSVCHKL